MKTTIDNLTTRERELFDAYLAGFDATGEGFNGEYPYADHGINPAPELLPKFRAWLRSINRKQPAVHVGTTRKELEEELRRLEGLMRDATVGEHRRAKEIVRQLNRCTCRLCGKEYDAVKARGDYRGYCSAKCQHQRSRELGYRKGKGRTEFDVLKRANAVGDVHVVR